MEAPFCITVRKKVMRKMCAEPEKVVRKMRLARKKVLSKMCINY